VDLARRVHVTLVEGPDHPPDLRSNDVRVYTNTADSAELEEREDENVIPRVEREVRLADDAPSLDEVVEHAAVLASSTPLPLSVDLENGYGPRPESAALAVQRIGEAGAVGGSIEDWGAEDGIYEQGLAVERVTAAVEAARRLPFPFTLTARAENHIRGNPDLDDTIARLQAFGAAGADVLYAPGLRTLDEIGAVCGAVAKPVNVLARPDLTMDELAEAGAQRVSVGGALTWTAVAAFASAAEAIRERGDFSGLGAGPPLDDWFR